MNELAHLYDWYEKNKRTLPWRETTDGYKIWLSEVILQQTRVVQGLEYYQRFVSRWPDVQALARAEEAEILREWQGLGYYTRARNLFKAAQYVVSQGWSPFPTTFEQLRSLPGVGEYTAGAIASFAYNLPYPAMDGNVYRVVSRLKDIDEPFDTSAGKKLFHQEIESLLDRENPRLFNSAIMEFGALYCTPTLTSPDMDGCVCDQCPLAECCRAKAHNTAALLPIRKQRPKIKDRYFTYFILVKNGDNGEETVIHQRTEKDIWQHLWEFPLIESDHLMSQEEADTLLHSKSFSIDLTHILSHQKLHARFYVSRVKVIPSKWTEGTENKVVAIPQLDDYALSRLTLKAIEKIGIFA